MISNLFEKSLDEIKHDEQLAYVLGTRKAEKPLLDKIGYNLENTSDDIDHTVIEYNDKDHGIRRLDLGVFLKDQDHPRVICEAKYYYTSDRVFKKKRNGERSRNHQWVLKDIRKLNQIQDRFRKENRFCEKVFLFFLIHYDSMKIPEYFPYSHL